MKGLVKMNESSMGAVDWHVLLISYDRRGGYSLHA